MIIDYKHIVTNKVEQIELLDYSKFLLVSNEIDNLERPSRLIEILSDEDSKKYSREQQHM